MNKISTIIPVFNADKFLESCIESILCQTYKNFEIILVDDCSTDHSKEIMDSYEKKYNNVKCIYKDHNEGPGAARNSGLDIASGEFISFCDSDDQYRSDFFDKMLSKVGDNIDIVLCEIEYLTVNGKINKKTLSNVNSFSTKSQHIAYSNMSLCRMLTRRELWNNLRLPSIYNSEDAAVIPVLFDRARSITFINETLYLYKLRKNSASVKMPSMRVYKDQLIAFDYIREYFKIRHSDEVEFLGINLVMYGAIMSAIKAKEENIIIKSIISEFKIMYPRFLHNKYIKSLSMKKRFFVVCSFYKQLFPIKLFVLLHHFMLNNIAS